MLMKNCGKIYKCDEVGQNSHSSNANVNANRGIYFIKLNVMHWFRSIKMIVTLLFPKVNKISVQCTVYSVTHHGAKIILHIQ